MNKYVAKLSWQVGLSDDGKLLREFLRQTCQISKRGLADIKFNGGLILVNEKEVTVRSVISKGDLVSLYLPTEKVSDTLLAEHIKLDILYEDDHFLVINKKAGMPTIPSRLYTEGTLANAVIGYFNEQQILSTFHAVNRLDKDTSGLLVIAKHRFAHDQLSKCQQDDKLHRYYKAIVHGKLVNKEGIINAPIGRNPESIITRKIREDGKRAITYYETEDVFDEYSLVAIKLETGRTHQIRVHFSSIDHPLLGDDLYGGSKLIMKRQALHCYKVEFTHPFHQRQVIVEADLPEDMLLVLEQARVEE
ncbi:RluA family pseudouridine synthase [Bacillus suaedae]|uniref:RluA family pseudouridine synthase n=1 Tax=Halalkalibacter suaedae TaxID=2822140 RepID=UPI003211C19A